MAQTELLQTLTEAGHYQAPTEPGMSCALSLMTQNQDVEVSESAHVSLGEAKHELKGLNDLYTQTPSKGQDERVMALCMAIEYAIAFRDHHSGHAMQDAEVIGILDKLGLKPESPLSDLGAQIQAWLRLELSLGEYSRNDLRQAIRKCFRSAKRHNSEEGERGYLGFIHHLLH